MNGAGSKARLEQGKTPAPVPTQPPTPQSTSELVSLQAGAGNAAVAATVTNKFQAPPFGGLQLQSTYGNAVLSESAVEEQSAPGVKTTPTGALIVGDEAEITGAGQMKKSDFLAELRSAMCDTTAEVLADTPWSEQGCPYIERWFSHYAGQDSAHIERALRKYAPETVRVTTAHEYISIVTRRVRSSIAEWKETGEVRGVPEEVAQGGMSGTTAARLFGGVLGGAVSSLASGIGQTVSGIGRLLFKHGTGAAASAADPRAIQAQLSSGHSLDGGVQSRMGAAFGADFSDVRVHTDSKAAVLSRELSARAFTIGRDVAFGVGEYQPGTPIGDALIAHELAHVVQQSGGQASPTAMPKGGEESGALEEEADVAAAGAVVKLWGGAKGSLADVGRNALPRLRPGLRLQRCGPSAPQRQTTPTAVTCATISAEQWASSVRTARAITDDDQRGAAMSRLAEQALCPLGIQVRAAGNSHRNVVHPDDYQPVPILNFDVRLNNKQRWRRSDEPPVPVGDNPGYNFSPAPSRSYAIIGPNALNENTPLTTRQYAQHELFMVSQAPSRPAGESHADFELATWTEDFVRYYHQYLELPLPQRPTWEPLIEYYEDPDQRAFPAARRAGPVTDQARQVARDRLVAYFRNPPVAATDKEKVQRQFSRWMRHRSCRLINDLNAILHPQTP